MWNKEVKCLVNYSYISIFSQRNSIRFFCKLLLEVLWLYKMIENDIMLGTLLVLQVNKGWTTNGYVRLDVAIK